MRIKIHRGTHEIGGCITEYEQDGWHLFVDYGEQLADAPVSKPLHIEGLNYGDLSKSALLITHYHGDHIGKIIELPDALPIFMGKMGHDIAFTFTEYLSHAPTLHDKEELMMERLNKMNTFCAGKAFQFGPFSIMPITVDHSAFDAYAFKITAYNISVFHTGDFRTHGFRSSKLHDVIKYYVRPPVDCVVTEATNINRTNAATKTEQQLQSEFEKSFHAHKGNIIYLSSTNIDRLFSIYHAALRAHRPFYVDKYQKKIMDDVADSNSMWTKSPLYQYSNKYPPKCLFEEHGKITVRDNFKEFLLNQGYVIIARPNPKFNDFISQIPGDKFKYLSMWKGYLDKSRKGAYNKNLDKALGKDPIYMHTSGHCDIEGLKFLLDMLKPKNIIPIHTENPEKFSEVFGNRWNVRTLNDGNSIIL